VNDIGQIISRLEHERAAIDRAILALREIEVLAPPRDQCRRVQSNTLRTARARRVCRHR